MPSIGPVHLDAPFYQAGLAGYSDAAMRLIARRHGCPYCVTEAMLDQFLINGGRGLKAAELDDEDHPIAGQLMGSHPDEIAAGAKVLLKFGYDVIDINLACPVKKIRRKCRGGHLLSSPDEAIAILDSVRQAVGDAAPCSVKLRRGSDDSPDAEANFHRIFAAVTNLGYASATVHGRTVEQKYIGPSRWAFLKRLTQEYGQTEGFSIFGSGDIFTARDIFAMLDETGVQAVSVARGCIGNPWIFEQARAMMRIGPTHHSPSAPGSAGGSPPPATPSSSQVDVALREPTLAQQRTVLREHFELSVRVNGEKKAGLMMRKFGIKFSRHHPDAEAVAQAFIAVKSLADWHRVLERHYTESAAAPVAIA